MKRLGIVGLVAAVASLCAGEVAPEPGRYRIYQRDVVRLAVNGEPDLSVDRRVDGQGEVSIPLLGQVKLAGLSATQAQTLIAQRYVADEIFVRPEVVVTILEYAPREVMVLGQVSKQGKQQLPSEAESVSIVEAITSAGGFNRIAKQDAVRVTRKDDAGRELSFTVNVEKIIQGRAAASEGFTLQPGDVVFVPERAF